MSHARQVIVTLTRLGDQCQVSVIAASTRGRDSRRQLLVRFIAPGDLNTGDVNELLRIASRALDASAHHL